MDPVHIPDGSLLISTTSKIASTAAPNFVAKSQRTVLTVGTISMQDDKLYFRPGVAADGKAFVQLVSPVLICARVQ